MAVLVRVCVLALACACARAFIDDAVEVLRLSKEISVEVLNSWEVLGKPLNLTGGVELPFFRRKERLLLSNLAQISRKIDRVEAELEKMGSLVTIFQKLSGKGTRLELKLNEMVDLVNRIEAADREMREYMISQLHLERRTLEGFAEWCVSHDRGALPGLLERVHALVAPPYHAFLEKGLFQLVAENLQQDESELCELQMSPNEIIYDMYNTVSLTEIKGYAMMQFSWMLLRVYEKGNYTQEASLTRKRYAERTSRTAVAAREALRQASRSIYRCYPTEHKLGETYEEVTRLLQGYIENEVDLNSDGTCREDCAHYTLSTHKGCYDQQGLCTKQPQCNGRVINCQFVDSDMWICPASRSSNRRYEFIEYENHRVLGKAGECKLGVTKVDSWWRWLFWHCSYCMCLCEEVGPNSDRYFSLRPATSDEKTNKVVTGVRIIKHGQVFHLQVSEGELGARGNVTPGDWVALRMFSIHDAGMTDGEDYHTLTYEKRAIDLDVLDSPQGHVLTGVRFRMLGAHLHFEIRATPFNFTTGRLSPDKSLWISNDNTDGGDTPREKLELIKPDIPTRTMVPLYISKHDQFVEFTNSDLDADAAQSTVPFIDIQPLMPMKGAALLSGAGVIHRGGPNNGGFVALKLLSYDQSVHVHAQQPPHDEETSNDLDFTHSV